MSVNHRLVNPLTDQLFDGILTLKTREECYEFFEDLCTINELRDMSQRLEVARMLEAGDKYDRIEEATGREHCHDFPREALFEIRCRRICAGALPDGKRRVEDD